MDTVDLIRDRLEYCVDESLEKNVSTYLDDGHYALYSSLEMIDAQLREQIPKADVYEI